MKTRPRYKSRAGFSLIELLLVLVILAVLVSIVVVSLMPQSENAKKTAAQADISNFDLLLDTFKLNVGRYPTDQEGLQALVVQPSNVTGWLGPYLKKGLNNDPWGHAYVYHCPGQHNTNSFDLSSFGPNGQEGDADDITNWSTSP